MGVSEAGWVDRRREPKVLPPGWEWYWVENPWTRKWETLMLPKKEDERKRREKLSYWGEREWGRKIKEERAKVQRGRWDRDF